MKQLLAATATILAIASHAHAQSPDQAEAMLPTTLVAPLDPDKVSSTCDDGGLLYDDGFFETGYRRGSLTVAPSEFAMRFDPPAGGKVQKACVCFMTSNAVSNVLVDVRVWAADGPGQSPGTLLGERQNLTFLSLPFAGKFYEVDLSPLDITVDGPFYVGVQWTPAFETGDFICVDQSPSTPLRQGYTSLGLPDAVPPNEPIQTASVNFVGYKALGLRATMEDSGTGCVPDADTLCLVDGRFEVEIEWETSADSGVGQARAIPGVDFSGLFWFFNANNLEMLVKVLDACALNQKFWVFYAATTNVGFDMTVTDTSTGVQKVYRNSRGTAALPVQDTNAFSCAGLEP